MCNYTLFKEAFLTGIFVGTPQVLIGGNCSVEIRAEIKVKNIDCLEDAGPTHQAKSKAWDQTYNSMSRADA